MNKILKLLLLVATLAIILIPNVAAIPTTSVVRQQSLKIDSNGPIIEDKTLGVAEAPKEGMLDGVIYFKIENYPAPGEIFRVSLENRGENAVLVNVIMNPEEKWRGTKVALKATQKQNISYFGNYTDKTSFNVSAFSFETFYAMSDEPLIELKYDQSEDRVKIWVRNDDELVSLRFDMKLTNSQGEVEDSFDFSLGPEAWLRQDILPSSSMGTYTLRGNYTDWSTGVKYDFEKNIQFAQSPKLSPSPKINPAGVLFWMVVIVGVVFVGYLVLRKKGGS